MLERSLAPVRSPVLSPEPHPASVPHGNLGGHPWPAAMLTVFFDGTCALCSAEMQELHRLDHDREVEFIDCGSAAFDESPWRAQGVTRAQMMSELHVRDVLGDWHRGVDAIALVYATVGAPWLARLWAHRLTRPLTTRLYPWVVQHRHRFAAFGLHLFAPKVVRLFAARTRVAGCAHGRCTHATLLH